MAKKNDPDLAARLREESETSMNDPYPTGAEASRPNRGRFQAYSVRLGAEE